jgi:hypothetical protein
MNDFTKAMSEMTVWPSLNPVAQYWMDAWQRSILLLDTLRQRGNIYQEHNAERVPHVLKFDHELIMDGRKLPNPVNYGLVRIIPPAGTKLDPEKHPIIIVDPRAGHGPGIGGMKHDSQIGVALNGGHPCYFVGFSPHPMPRQTVEDVCMAEAQFVEEVARRHPDAAGKPVIIGNCQAGWQIMMMAAIKPDLPGPIMLAGSPLSYWAGVRGKNPLRYLGGLLGGTRLTALCGDLGNGIFDGAYLVQNFESLNPANTFWTKPYNVYSKVDTETERFLDFETWWGSPVLLNAEEMHWIADNLFVGNKLSTGQIRTSGGVRVDLRNIKSPIIVSAPGATTSPRHNRRLTGFSTSTMTRGSSSVPARQSSILCTTASDTLAFLSQYEAVITEVDENTRNPNLIHGRYLFRLEARTLNDIRALGGNDAADELRFATAARVSEINHGLYSNFVSPTVRGMIGEQTAELLRATHPNRLRFSMLSDQNPMMQPIKITGPLDVSIPGQLESIFDRIRSEWGDPDGQARSLADDRRWIDVCDELLRCEPRRHKLQRHGPRESSTRGVLSLPCL